MIQRWHEASHLQQATATKPGIVLALVRAVCHRVTEVRLDPDDLTDTDPDGDGEPDDPTVTPLPMDPELQVTKTDFINLGGDGAANPGDVIICNRQLVHGSFPNSGFERRVTVNFGFHRRSSVLGVMGAGIHNEAMLYDADLIEQRSRVIGYAIDARKRRYPDEESYQYRPFAESGKEYTWNDEARDGLKDYNLYDLSI